MGRKKVLPQLLTRSSPSTGRTLAYARFDRQVVSFGPAGPEAERRFHMALAEWLASGRVLPDVEPEVLTVADVVAAFLEHAEHEYRPVELYKLKRAFLPVLERFRSLPAAKFDVSCLEAVQRHLANDLHQRVVIRRRRRRKSDPDKPAPKTSAHYLSRATIRSRINAVRKCWRWAGNRLVVDQRAPPLRPLAWPQRQRQQRRNRRRSLTR